MRVAGYRRYVSQEVCWVPGESFSSCSWLAPILENCIGVGGPYEGRDTECQVDEEQEGSAASLVSTRSLMFRRETYNTVKPLIPPNIQ
jgi:hypothetical protein